MELIWTENSSLTADEASRPGAACRSGRRRSSITPKTVLWTSSTTRETRSGATGSSGAIRRLCCPPFSGPRREDRSVYIDPPFDTGRDFPFLTAVAREDGAAADETALIEQNAYRDTWRSGIDLYLQWFYRPWSCCASFWQPTAVLYVHLDWRAGHYAKAVLDEVFGAECFQNEIAWCYREAINSTKRWNRKHDDILYYVKDPASYCFNPDAVLQPARGDHHSEVSLPG